MCCFLIINVRGRKILIIFIIFYYIVFDKCIYIDLLDNEKKVIRNWIKNI